ncbi:MAG: hypothetical protein HXS53_02680 [Theionarchaea archaeon]|nr:hypothetical protein [Theionarchaea archaeon]
MNVAGIIQNERCSVECSDITIFLTEIRKNNSTGYLIVEWNTYQFLLFFENGTPTHGFRVIEERLYVYSDLVIMLPSFSEGQIYFYPAPPEVLQALLDIKFGAELYGVLYTSYTDMSRLFTLLHQNSFSGSVKIDLPSGSRIIVIDHGVLSHIMGSKETGDESASLESLFQHTLGEDGTIHVYERRNPPRLMTPDAEAVCSWSSPEHLILKFAYGQLGKELEFLLGMDLTLSTILERLHVDFIEIADMYTYLSAKGYIALKKPLR